MNICVYCSSSNGLDAEYYKIAKDLGNLIADNCHDLVYGGSNVGLMNVIAKTVKSHNRKVVGVIPKIIYDKGLGHSGIDELIVTNDMGIRKKKMAELADAFIAMPGGFGTLEEILEIITLKQLQEHSKAIVLLNSNGFYNSLIEFFEVFFKNNFAKEHYRDYYFLANTPQEAIDYINNYQAPDFTDKWYWVNSEEFDKNK